ncbi:MAG: hypothetical protein QM820_59475 [Minicystis sp.]
MAIVERAMAPDPEARYATAEQLAEDLKRWQAGRLVEAHRYTPGDRLRRFVRRYRAPLLVAAAALVILTGLGGVGQRRIFAERRNALAEQARAEAARGRAEAQRAAAETLVSFILGDLRGRLSRVGRLDALSGVAHAVVTYQDESPAAEDAATSLRRSEAAGLAGDVAFATGNLDAAEESFQRSRKPPKRPARTRAPPRPTAAPRSGWATCASGAASWTPPPRFTKDAPPWPGARWARASRTCSCGAGSRSPRWRGSAAICRLRGGSSKRRAPPPPPWSTRPAGRAPTRLTS